MASKKQPAYNRRKYLNWILLLVSIVLLCFVVSRLYGIYKDNKLKESVLTRTVGTIQYDDIENATRELVSDDFILVSFTMNEEVRKLELKLKDIIIDNDLQNNFFYLDATELMLEKKYINSLNTKLSLSDENKIEALPALLYYKEGKLVKTISSTKNQMISADDFSKLLDNYEIIER